MNILKICTYNNGGATIAAKRQAQALREQGASCMFLYMHESLGATEISVDRGEYEIQVNIPASVWSYSGRLVTAYCNGNRTPVSNTWLSFFHAETMWDDTLLDICREFDVIHFHWIAHCVSARLLERLGQLGKRLVFTGHDMNHFTGACHYGAGCRKYTKDCQGCPQLVTDFLGLVSSSLRLKLATCSRLRATWLFPSQWLANEFRLSRLQDTAEATQLLYNCLDARRYAPALPEARRELRRALGFQEHEAVCVAGAANNAEQRKGFAYLEGAVDHLCASLAGDQGLRQRCVVVTFGRGKPSLACQSPYVRHIHLGPVGEERIIALFQAADELLLPSIEENFSNTILESLLCGCPVLAFAIGGVPDIVQSGVNGWLVDEVSQERFSSVFAEAIEPASLASMRTKTEAWRAEHARDYDYPLFADRLLHIYGNPAMVTSGRTGPEPPPSEPDDAVYASLLAEARPSNELAYSVLEQAIIRHKLRAVESLETGWTEPVRRAQASIPALITGITSTELHETYGRVAWLCKQAGVIFRPRAGMRPALCLLIPNESWVISGLDTSLDRLTTSLNGQPARLHRVGGPDDRFTYLWVLPDPDSLVPDTYNALRLSCSAPYYEESQDQRLICILYNQIALYDLNVVLDSPDALPDYSTSTLCALRTEQTDYLGDTWNAEKNERALVPIAARLWLDILEYAAPSEEGRS